MRDILHKTSAALLALLLLLGCTGTALADGIIAHTTQTDEAYGSYERLEIAGFTPYVFVPAAAGTGDAADYRSVAGMAEELGGRYGVIAAISGGIFYNAGLPVQYCFAYKEPDGVVIAGGVVLKSEESIDHSECDILVIDEDGAVGWAEYFADADALAAGTGSYYNMYGETVTGKRILSAVTGFVPILVAGESVYDETDEALHGYDNFVGHYTQAAARQIFGVRADGTYVVLSNRDGWTLADAAQAAMAEGCVFAFNLDGGGSAETVLAYDAGAGVEVHTVREQSRGTRSMPTYIVFTSGNVMPASGVPVSLTAAVREDASLSAGASLAEIAAALDVTETLLDVYGEETHRAVYSAMTRDPTAMLEHTVIGGSSDDPVEKMTSVSPDGTLYYTKTDDDAMMSLRLNANTRADGRYYDYSTGFSVEADGDLATPGEKTILVTYTPGGGLEPLQTAVTVTLNP